jgi:hypothetical protein
MGNLSSLIAMTLTAILVPLVARRIPYFKRPAVVARRAAKAQLPGWVSIAELIFLLVSEAVLIIPFYLIERYAHQALHPGRNFLAPMQPSFSADLIFWLIQALAPLIMTLPLGMLLANLISWSIPPIRNVENIIIEEGVPGYNWHDLNFGLIRYSLIASPICVILTVISLIQL